MCGHMSDEKKRTIFQNKNLVFPHLLYQILDLLQVSINTGSVQRRLALLVPFVPLKQEPDTEIAEGKTLGTWNIKMR